MTELVKWSEKLAAEAKDVAKLERPALSSISLKAGVMQLGGTPIPGNKLQAIVVGSIFQQRYYTQKWDPNNPANPDCFALSADGQGMAPHPDSKKPQAATCTACPHNQWGSDVNGGRGKACKTTRRLGLLPASAASDGSAAKAEIALLTIPVMSVKNWGNYVNRLSAEFRRPAWAVVTEVSTVPDVKSQFRVNFDFVRLIPEEELGALHARAGAVQDLLMTPYEPSTDAPPPKETKPAKY